MAKIDGYVTIGFKGDKTQLEKDIKDIDRQLVQYEKEREKLGKDIIETEDNIKGYEIEIKHYDRLINKANDYREKLRKLNSELTRMQEDRASFIAISNKRKEMEGVEKEYNRINDQLNREANKNEQIIEKYDEAKIKLDEMKDKLRQITAIENGSVQVKQSYVQQVDDINRKLDIQQQQQQKVNRLNQNIQNFGTSMGNSMEKLVKKTVKWGLAIFGVRSAYSLISRSMSILSQYDKQLSTNIEYIRWTLATALKPVIEWIIKAVFKLIQFINTLVYRLTGINLLANATPKKFKEATDELKNTNKQAKELRKQFAGFDEMDILGDNVKSAGDSSSSMPNFNLGKLLSDKELNEIFEKIKKKAKELVDIVVDYLQNKINNLKAPALKGLLGIADIFFADNPEEIVLNATKMGINVTKVVVEAVNLLLKIAKVVLSEDSTDALLGPIKKLIADNPVSIGIKGLEFKNKDKEIKSAIGGVQATINKNPLKLNKIDISAITNAFTGLPGKAQTAYNSIKNIFSALPNFFKTTFANAWKGVLGVFSTNGTVFKGIKEAINNVFKKEVNGIFGGLDTVINKPFKDINGVLNKIHDTSILGIKPFSKLWPKNLVPTIKIPRLKTGAVINQPGRGVFHNGAIMGENGAEGILPLTDESAMELLGRTIGKYVTIQANITNNMNGRLISRIVQEIMAEQDFAYNR